MTQTVFALVDYDNQRPLGFGSGNRSGRPPNLRDHEYMVDILIDELCILREALCSGFAELRIRLYGGWTESIDGLQTESGNMLMNIIATRSQARRRQTRVFIELADTLISAPHEFIFRTYRTTPWEGRMLTVAEAYNGCPHYPGACAELARLRRWTKHGKCPDQASFCEVKTKHAVTQDGQKMVDTMIVADTLFLATQDPMHYICIVSMDDDMIPGLLASLHFNRRIHVVRFGKRAAGDYDPLLRRNGVAIHDMKRLGDVR